jgi:hypothetical protein
MLGYEFGPRLLDPLLALGRGLGGDRAGKVSDECKDGKKGNKSDHEAFHTSSSEDTADSTLEAPIASSAGGLKRGLFQQFERVCHHPVAIDAEMEVGTSAVARVARLRYHRSLAYWIPYLH